MKKILSFFITVCCSLAVTAQNEPYRGGSADGHSKTEQITGFPLPTSFQPYLGGSGDGYSGVEIVIPFGFANNFAPFLGGNGDGFTSVNVISQVFAFPPHFYAFLGGLNDGWAGQLLPNAVILPLTLFQFRGEVQKDNNVLYWITDNEINTSHFLIERSANGADFLPMAQRTARGNYSGRTEYRLVDSFPLRGKNYYRIKMWDRDGSFKFSPTTVLEEQTLVKALIVFPNPVTQSLRIKLNEPANGTIQWMVYDLTGRRLIAERTNGASQLYQVNVSKLPVGNYVLEVEFDNRKETIQFTKQ